MITHSPGHMFITDVPELGAGGALSALRFLPGGDLAVSVELGEEISVEVNTRVRALEFLIQQKAPGRRGRDGAGFRSLLVYYDPAGCGYEALCASHRRRWCPRPTPRAAAGADGGAARAATTPELGLDLAAAAERLELVGRRSGPPARRRRVSRLLHRLHAGAART